MSAREEIRPIVWQGDHLALLDQTVLPREESWIRCDTAEEVADAIRRLAVRGAPAIGVAAAYGLALALLRAAEAGEDGLAALDRAAKLLAATRPTAINLRWALDRGRAVFAATSPLSTTDRARAVLDWARELELADVATNRAIGRHGAALFAKKSRVLTHCNAGALATAGYGTALGVIRSAFEAGSIALVYADETRPLLQGARLTAWELDRLGIPFRLIPDVAAGALMARGEIDAIVVGADRIAANGDTANKIGTYMLAVVAARHGIPFYVAAPRSTIDPRTPNGAAIPIEERSPTEVVEVFGIRVAPEGIDARNIAFDVTPAELIAGIVTEVGVLRPPYPESIARALAAP